MARLNLTCVFLALSCAAAGADDLGPFTSLTDIGDLGRRSIVTYDRSSGIYFLSASGENIWGEQDAFGFVSKPLKADAAIGARMRFMSKGGHAQRKAGVMFRQSLDPASVHAAAMVHGDGLTSLQYRAVTGGPTREIQCAQEAPTALRLEKRGDYIQLFTSNEDGVFSATGCLIRISLRGNFHAGLAVNARDNRAFESARFSSVTVGLPPERREVRIAAIEVVSLDSLARRVLWYSSSALEVPSFTATGDALCFREGGQLKRLPLTIRAEPAPVGMEDLDACAAAQPVLSAGQRVVHRVDGGRSQLWLESAGGEAKRISHDNRNHWLPRMAPDAQSYVFLSGSAKADKGKPGAGDYLLTQQTCEGGAPRVLAAFFGGQGSLGISPWSPDGKRIVFVSREPD
jgi:hypothetical protein